MLSFSEVVAKDNENILLGVFAGSTTSKNLRSGRSACLMIIVGKASYYVKGITYWLREGIRGMDQVHVFNLKVDQVLEDSSPYAEITSPITFRDKGVGEPHERVFKALRSMRPHQLTGIANAHHGSGRL